MEPTDGPEQEGLIPTPKSEKALNALARAQIADAEARKEEAGVRKAELGVRQRELDLHEQQIEKSWSYAERQLEAEERIQTNNTNKGLWVFIALLAAFVIFMVGAMLTDNANLAIEVVKAIVYGGSGWLAGRAFNASRQGAPAPSPRVEE